MARREQDEPRLGERVAVWAEDSQGAIAGGEIELDPVAAAEDEALGGKGEVVPALELLGVAVVLLEVGRDPQEPGRAADQADLVVAAPAAAVLDLNRGEGRLAGVTPVDRGVVAVDQAGLEQGHEQPLGPAVLALVGAVEDAVVVEGEAEALHLPQHPLAALRHPLGWRLLALDSRQLGREPEGVEAEAEEHRVAAGAAEASVGVADRVVADVAHMQVAGGERARGLYVGPGLARCRARRLEVATGLPGGLPGRLDPARVIARLALAHLALKANLAASPPETDHLFKRSIQSGPQRYCYCESRGTSKRGGQNGRG
jgi:hypothetical protein